MRQDINAVRFEELELGPLGVSIQNFDVGITNKRGHPGIYIKTKYATSVAKVVSPKFNASAVLYTGLKQDNIPLAEPAKQSIVDVQVAVF